MLKSNSDKLFLGLSFCILVKIWHEYLWTPNVGTGSICDGSDYEDLYSCCTVENPCGEWEGACKSNAQCMDNLDCGQFNCDITSNFTDYSGFQKFDCCYSGT